MVSILGIKLTQINQGQTLEKIAGWLKENQPHYLVTPNPEIILSATKDQDEELFYILNNADLSLADGIGLKFAAWLYRKKLPRVTGADLIKPLLKLAQEQQYRVLFLLWDQGLSREADVTKVIKKKYPQLLFTVKEIGRAPETNIELAGDIALVALGAPYQEKFIFKNKDKIKGLKVAIGIGGALDFLTKKAKRAPRLMRFVGFEWLWRLIRYPKRIKRMYRALIIFPLQVLLYRFIMPHQYRPNVAGLLYKKEQGRYKIFLVERRLNPGHWQFIQGGTDGLGIKETGIKELQEETGTSNFKVRAVYDFLYRYKFGSEIGRFPTQRHTGYKGQKQALVIAEYLGNGDDIKINFWDHSAYQWADLDEVLDIVHPLRKESVAIYLNKLKAIL